MGLSSILDLKAKYTENDAIKSYEFSEYLPTSGSNINIPGTITIHIECLDEFYHPRRSCLLVEGDLLKAADEERYDDENIALSNNGIMHLFSNVKYELVGSELESINDPGIAGVMMGIAKNTYEYGHCVGMKSCWAPDTSDTIFAERGFLRRKEYILSKSLPKGSFSFLIEMEDIFGFHEDYVKVTYGMRHKMTLVRKGDDDAIFAAAGTEKGKVKLSKISLLMPRVLPNDIKKFDLYKMIESKVILDAGYRRRQCHMAEITENSLSFDWRLGVRSSTEKPRHILLAFQDNRSGAQDKNPSLFDHVNTTQISVVLNDTKYPCRDVVADFPSHKYVEYYKMFTDFTKDYYHVDPLMVGNFVDIITYKEEYPIFYINVEHQSERMNQGVVDIMIRMKFGKNIGKNIVAYALVISDRRIRFESDGKKMSILY